MDKVGIDDWIAFLLMSSGCSMDKLDEGERVAAAVVMPGGGARIMIPLPFWPL